MSFVAASEGKDNLIRIYVPETEFRNRVQVGTGADGPDKTKASPSPEPKL